VLLTDGENNRGAIDPRTAAQAAGVFNVRIYTIGVGSEGTAPMPVSRGVFGLRYENRPVRIDETLLEDIARSTNGRYFRARDAAALERIYEQIDQLERSPTRVARYRPFIDEYRWPLGIALGALALELVLLAWRSPLP
jgi:Ca-activated chloride channel family protein